MHASRSHVLLPYISCPLRYGVSSITFTVNVPACVQDASGTKITCKLSAFLPSSYPGLLLADTRGSINEWFIASATIQGGSITGAKTTASTYVTSLQSKNMESAARSNIVAVQEGTFIKMVQVGSAELPPTANVWR